MPFTQKNAYPFLMLPLILKSTVMVHNNITVLKQSANCAIILAKTLSYASRSLQWSPNFRSVAYVIRFFFNDYVYSSATIRRWTSLNFSLRHCTVHGVFLTIKMNIDIKLKNLVAFLK